MFKRATKQQSRLRLALMGPTGSGKTFTALTVAHELGKKVALIDSERASASKYSDLFPPFDSCDLESHSPEVYIKAIKGAERDGYDVLVIDSLSHAWMGKDGALELADKATKKSQSGNSFTAWREVTPLHNQLVDAILQSKCHIIVTLRTKQEYILEAVERNGRTVMQPKKVGLAPIQKSDIEYEFDVVADMNLDHDLIVTKTRCHAIDGLVVRKPDKDFARTLGSWLSEGVEAPKSVEPSSSTVALTQDNEPYPAGVPATATDSEIWNKQIHDFAKTCRIPNNFVATYFTKLGHNPKKANDWLTFEVFEQAIIDLGSVQVLWEKQLGESHEGSIPADVLKDAFREVLNLEGKTTAPGEPGSDKPNADADDVRGNAEGEKGAVRDKASKDAQSGSEATPVVSGA